MEQALQIIQYVVCGLAVLFSIIQFIIVKAKGAKNQFVAKSLDFLNEIATTLGFAEQMTKLKGDDKKSFAKDAIAMYCENKKIKITDEQLGDAIETLIRLTKTVNAREKDLIEAANELDGDAQSDNTELAGDKPDTQNGELI